MALSAVLNDLRAEPVDHIVCLGEVATGGPQPAGVVAQLKALNCPVVMGNIFEDRLETILSSKYLEQWRSAVPDLCTKCDLYTKCYGGCRAAAEQLGLSLYHPDPILYGIPH